MKTKQILCIFAIIFVASLSSAGITTSFPILTLIVRELTGPEIEVKTLTHSGEEAHHFEMNPKTLMNLQQQDLLIVNGLGFEHWLAQIEKNKLMKGKIVVASEGVSALKSANNNLDPHAWHDPALLLVYIDNIQKALISRFPKQKHHFDEKAKTLKEKILNWKKQKDLQFAKLPHPFCIITAHSAFSYLARAFNFKSIALLGDHEGENISPRQLILKVKELETYPQRVFFGEGSQQDQTLKEWAKKTSSPWGGILLGDSLDQTPPSLDLLGYLEYNTSAILKATQFSSKH